MPIWASKRASYFVIFRVAAHGFKGKVGKEAHLENWLTSLPSLTPGDSVFGVTFDWDESIGVPGALIINNNHTTEFFLKTITLEDVPGEGLVHFVCNSWVYPAGRYKYERIFFRNKVMNYCYFDNLKLNLSKLVDN